MGRLSDGFRRSPPTPMSEVGAKMGESGGNSDHRDAPESLPSGEDPWDDRETRHFARSFAMRLRCYNLIAGRSQWANIGRGDCYYIPKH